MIVGSTFCLAADQTFPSEEIFVDLKEMLAANSKYFIIRTVTASHKSVSVCVTICLFVFLFVFLVDQASLSFYQQFTPQSQRQEKSPGTITSTPRVVHSIKKYNQKQVTHSSINPRSGQYLNTSSRVSITIYVSFPRQSLGWTAFKYISVSAIARCFLRCALTN